MANRNEQASPEMPTDSTITKRDPEQSTAPPDTMPHTNIYFPQFASVPVEICLMILQERLDTELIPSLRTLTIMYRQPHLLTRGTRYKDRGLWHTGNSLLRDVIERRSVMIPARQLTHPGTNIYHLDEGLTSLSCEQHRDMGVRPTPKGTVFYMVYETASHLLKMLQDRSIDSSKLDWLGSLLLDYQTFRALARGISTDGPRGSPVELVQLFELLPNLRVLYLGFAPRWTEVVLVEGLVAADLLIPVQVPEIISHGEIEAESSNKWNVEAPDGIQLHEGLKVIILTVVRESLGEISALESAGIEVKLVVVQKEAIVRRLDVIRGYDIPDS